VGADLYGHGRSDGPHSYIPSVDDLVEDLNDHVEDLKKKPENAGLPVFILGMSLGGLVTLKYSMKYPHGVKGLVLLCPLLIPASQSSPKVWVRRIMMILHSLSPELPVARANKGKGYSIKEAMLEDAADKREYHGGLRIGTGVALLRALDTARHSLHLISAPFLLIHGDSDAVVDIEGSKTLIDDAVSEDKTFIELEGSDHALMQEPLHVRNRIFAEIDTWLSARI